MNIIKRKNGLIKAHTPKGYNAIIIAICISIILPLIFYRYQFSGGLSSDHTIWSEFSTFFSGITGTILSFINMIILTFTLVQQKKRQELDEKDKDESDFKAKFNDMISQKNRIVESFSDGNFQGNKDIRYRVFTCINTMKSNGLSFLDYDIFIRNIAKFTSLFNFIIYIGDEIETMESSISKKYYSLLRALLSAEEMMLLLIFRGTKEISPNTLKMINSILGDYKTMSLTDFTTLDGLKMDDIGFFTMAYQKNIINVKI